MKKVLSDILKKETVEVDVVNHPNPDIVEELETLGFTPGTKTTVFASSVFSGPITLLLRGAKIAIRKQDAMYISVNPV